MNLKQIREYLGITQGELSQKTGINIPTLSNYESGSIPMLEHCIVIERQLGQRLTWEEPLTPKQKHGIIQNLIYLAENYNLQSVLNFAPRAFKEGQRIGDAGQFIKHYATISGVNDEPPLLSNI